MLSAKNLYCSIFLCVLPRWCKFPSLQLCWMVLRAPRSQASLGSIRLTLCLRAWDLGVGVGWGCGREDVGGESGVISPMLGKPRLGVCSVHAELWPFSKPPLSLPRDYDSDSGIRILALELDFTCYCVIWAIYSISSGLSFYIYNEVCHSSYPPTYRSLTFASVFLVVSIVNN